MSGYYLETWFPSNVTQEETTSSIDTSNVVVSSAFSGTPHTSDSIIADLKDLQDQIVVLQTSIDSLETTLQFHTHTEFALKADVAESDHIHNTRDVLFNPVGGGEPIPMNTALAQLDTDIDDAVAQTETMFSTLFQKLEPISPGADNIGETGVVNNDEWWGNLATNSVIETGVQLTSSGETETPAQYFTHYQITSPGLYLVDLSFRNRTARSITEWRVRPIISQSTPGSTHLTGDWVGVLYDAEDTSAEGFGLVTNEYFEITQAMIDNGGAYVNAEMSYKWNTDSVDVASGTVVMVHICNCYLFRPAVTV